MKYSGWKENEAIQWIFEDLQKQNIIDVRGEVLYLYSTNIKSHHNLAGPKKALVAKKGGIAMTKTHAAYASEKFALKI